MSFKGTIHLTHTGYYAGRVFCGAVRTEVDTYMHIPYSHTKEFLTNPALCPDCLEVLEASENAEPEAQ